VLDHQRTLLPGPRRLCARILHETLDSPHLARARRSRGGCSTNRRPCLIRLHAAHRSAASTTTSDISRPRSQRGRHHSGARCCGDTEPVGARRRRALQARGFGDPDGVHRSLDAVWAHVAAGAKEKWGRPLFRREATKGAGPFSRLLHTADGAAGGRSGCDTSRCGGTARHTGTSAMLPKRSPQS
jgi:hypothetical protein